MSKLATKSYNFRLDPRIPREKEVITALESWQEKDWTVRQIVTELVLSQQGIELSEPKSEAMSTRALRRLEHLINDEVLSILKEMRDRNPDALQDFARSKLPPVKATNGDEPEPIDANMLDAIQRARRGRSVKRSDLE